MPPGNPMHPFPGFPATFPLGGENLTPAQERAERDFLVAVQGNILKGHGRDHARLVFFRFGPDVAKNRQLLRDAVSDGWVQSAWTQRMLAKEHRPKQVKYPEFYGYKRTASTEAARDQLARLLFSCLGLTPWGLAHVGCVDGAGHAPPRGDFPSANNHPGAFSVGMKTRMEIPPVQPGFEPLTRHWQEAYTNDPARAIHGMFQIACDDAGELEHQYARLKTWLAADRHGARVVHVEQGTTWRFDGRFNRFNREPFGFVDGISLPRFFHEDRENRDPKEWAWVDLKLADVFVTPEQSPVHAGASFMSFLKLEQDVEAFHAHAQVLQGRRSDRPDEAGHAPAFALGRLPDGCPLHRAGRADQPTEQALNSFDFASIQDGNPQTSDCPFHAHIRKMNPRTDLPDHHAGRETIIRAQPVRRGMIYDDDGALRRRINAGHGPWPSGGTGLLFMAYMASVARQFELLHNDWALKADFPPPGNGEADGILHPGVADWEWRGTRMPKGGSFVKRLGGHYLYVPSLPWLGYGGQMPQS